MGWYGGMSDGRNEYMCWCGIGGGRERNGGPDELICSTWMCIDSYDP